MASLLRPSATPSPTLEPWDYPGALTEPRAACKARRSTSSAITPPPPRPFGGGSRGSSPPESRSTRFSTLPDALRGSASRKVLRSEEHTSELQSHLNLVCRLLLEKKKNKRVHSERALRDGPRYRPCAHAEEPGGPPWAPAPLRPISRGTSVRAHPVRPDHPVTLVD